MNYATIRAREETERRRYIFAVAMRAPVAIAAIAICFALCGCSDDSEPVTPAVPSALESTPAPHLIEWLRLTDRIAPERWLASREAKADLDASDPAVADMRRILDVAASRFRDQPRMIANRAVQLETMLKEKSIDEGAPRLIVTLAQVPGPTRCIESFASLTQQYFNLRMGGFSRAQAIDTLKKRLDERLSESGHH